jgi:hypothetical protein
MLQKFCPPRNPQKIIPTKILDKVKTREATEVEVEDIEVTEAGVKDLEEENQIKIRHLSTPGIINL